MANSFYTPDQVAKTAVELASEDAFLSALVSRDLQQDLLGGGGKGRAVNVRIPAALIARTRGIDDVTNSIVLDELTEQTISIKLGEHLYSAVGLSEGDMNLDLQSFANQVLTPQVDSVVDYVEELVAFRMLNVPDEDEESGFAARTSTPGLTWDEDNPAKTFTAMRKILRQRGVPQTGLNVVVGTNVYAALLDSQILTDAAASGSTAALRDGNVGKLRGFQIVESTRVPDDSIIAFHKNAFTLAVRAPLVPAGQDGSIATNNGFALRYLRDYDVMHTMHRSMVSTFAGVEEMPLYKVTRNREDLTAEVEEVEGGAVVFFDTLNPVEAGEEEEEGGSGAGEGEDDDEN